jgi:excisionase family DNA binding protein
VHTKNLSIDSSSNVATLTIPQACHYTGLYRSFMYKLFNSGKLMRLKAGKRALIRKADLDTYLESIREVSTI